jgi:hypothetical protein
VTSHTCNTFAINSLIFKFLFEPKLLIMGPKKSLEDILSALTFKPNAILKKKCRIWLNLRSHICIVWAEGANGFRSIKSLL